MEDNFNEEIDNIITLKVGSEIPREQLITSLYNIGYERETTVTKTGDISIRGFIIDIFPITATNPIRLEFWGDTLDSIRIFDADTQKTIDNTLNVIIKPNTEFITSKSVDDKNQKHLPKYDVCHLEQTCYLNIKMQ